MENENNEQEQIPCADAGRERFTISDDNVLHLPPQTPRRASSDNTLRGWWRPQGRKRKRRAKPAKEYRPAKPGTMLSSTSRQKQEFSVNATLHIHAIMAARLGYDPGIHLADIMLARAGHLPS